MAIRTVMARTAVIRPVLMNPTSRFKDLVRNHRHPRDRQQQRNERHNGIYAVMSTLWFHSTPDRTERTMKASNVVSRRLIRSAGGFGPPFNFGVSTSAILFVRAIAEGV